VRSRRGAGTKCPAAAQGARITKIDPWRFDVGPLPISGQNILMVASALLLMLALFGVLVWIPRLIAHPEAHLNWSEFGMKLSKYGEGEAGKVHLRIQVEGIKQD